MARTLTIPGVTLADPSAPFYGNKDPVESSGSLVLIDPTHPVQQWAAGAPAHDSYVPNVLHAKLATLAGVADTAAQTSAKIYRTLSSTKGLVERSSKGGLHGVISPTVTTVNLDGLNVYWPDALLTYIKANPTHAYYFSTWYRTTRADTSPSNISISVFATDSKFVYAPLKAANFPGTNLGVRGIVSTVAPHFMNMAAVPDSGIAADASSSPGQRSALIVGNLNAINSNSARLGKGGSHILYRAYAEDLTVSGRSYATVDALDADLYNAEVITAGGRYQGDTFTDPATIA